MEAGVKKERHDVRRVFLFCLLLPKKMHLEKPCGPMDSSFYAICIFVFLRFF